MEVIGCTCPQPANKSACYVDNMCMTALSVVKAWSLLEGWILSFERAVCALVAALTDISLIAICVADRQSSDAINQQVATS